MVIKFDKKRVKELLEKYYKDEYDCDGKVTITASRGCVGYGMGEHIECIVKATFSGSMDVLGEVTEFKVELYSEDIIRIIKQILEDNGYSVSNVSCDSGFDYRTEGYGMGEETKSYPYFNGVEVRLNEKIKNKGEMKNEKR